MDLDLAGARASAHKVVLAQLGERPYTEITHDSVAEQAGLPVAALRAMWPGIADLAMDAFADLVGPLPDYPPDVTLRDELLSVARRLVREYHEHGDVLITLMYEATRHPDLEHAFRERFLLPRIACSRKMFGNAMLRGELRPDVDPRLFLTLLPALLTYRTLLRDPPPEPHLADLMVDQVLLPLMHLPATT